MSEEMRGALEDYCARVFTDWPDIRVANLHCINSGWESDVYAFDLEHGPSSDHSCEPLILRIYPGAYAQEKAVREFGHMRTLHRVDYPVPRVFALETQASPFGRPFLIMERIEGSLLWSLMREPDRPDLFTLFCALFLRLHRLDWRPFVPDARRYEAAAPDMLVTEYLAECQEQLDELRLPGFGPVVNWLGIRGEGLRSDHPSVTHRDFHPGNIILRPDGSPVVFDWTGLRVTDARFDVAWTLLLAGAYVGPEWRQRILAEYERLAGASLQHMDFFDVAACFRRLSDIVASMSGGAEAMGMRPGAEDLMAEQMEATRRVYALLLQRTGIRVPEVEALLAPRPPF